jgi:hypothetical protein
MRALVWLAGSSSGPPGPAVRLGWQRCGLRAAGVGELLVLR